MYKPFRKISLDFTRRSRPPPPLPRDGPHNPGNMGLLSVLLHLTPYGMTAGTPLGNTQGFLFSYFVPPRVRPYIVVCLKQPTGRGILDTHISVHMCYNINGNCCSYVFLVVASHDGLSPQVRMQGFLLTVSC